MKGNVLAKPCFRTVLRRHTCPRCLASNFFSWSGGPVSSCQPVRRTEPNICNESRGHFVAKNGQTHFLVYVHSNASECLSWSLVLLDLPLLASRMHIHGRRRCRSWSQSRSRSRSRSRSWSWGRRLLSGCSIVLFEPLLNHSLARVLFAFACTRRKLSRVYTGLFLP